MHDFFMRTGSYPPDINRFRSHTGKYINFLVLVYTQSKEIFDEAQSVPLLIPVT